jgi:hypothetical protein
VITKTLESMPVNSAHWSTRLMTQKTGPLADSNRANLASFRVAAASRGELQVFQTPAVGREGSGYCRVVPESPGPRDCSVCRREGPWTWPAA